MRVFLRAKIATALGAIVLGASACSAILGLPDAVEDSTVIPGADGSVGGDGSASDGGNGSDGSAQGDAAACVGKDLTSDPLNCGRCGRNCGGGQCTQSKCAPVPLATSQGRPQATAVDGQRVYWTCATQLGTSGNVYAASKADGSGVVTIAGPTGVVDPWGIAVDANGVYWANHDYPASSSGVGGIRKCPLSGCAGAPQILADADDALDVVLSGGDLFFTADNAGEVRRVGAADGGSPLTLASGITAPFKLAVGGGYVYFTSNQSEVVRVPVDGGAQVQMGPQPGDRAGGIAVDAHHLFWSNPNDATPGSVSSRNLDSGLITPLPGTSMNPVHVVTDGTYVYWANLGTGTNAATRTDGSVLACPVDGCQQPIVLADHVNSATGLSLDDDFVYYVAIGLGSTDGAVMKVAKP